MTKEEIAKVTNLAKRKSEIEDFLRRVSKGSNNNITIKYEPGWSIGISSDQWSEIALILETELAIITEELENI